MRRPIPLLAFVLIAQAGCEQRKIPEQVARSGPTVRPDELPVLVSSQLPFQYPAELYARKVQGNVTLRLFIDRDGDVIDDSSRVEGPSGVPALDSAALVGSKELKFVPAKLNGEPVAVSVLFPVYFRHPEASAPPGDSALRATGRGSDDV